ncbi:uncharacterized protein BYT42DRAFT_577545 [Radiomyces spectabilis]|uniref:uncharacterized protein n=1 Tax=Radiomyces spectabilis TaxID=64574 RepID=UPI00221EF6C7|nr:uncharacterized protein BYT42DRAFT_577545 [Radiomyces spectabilis]KAI8374757.1 hypothetical protein BYT42DRAFT_577545 [Radiomyces spectabilis]
MSYWRAASRFLMPCTLRHTTLNAELHPNWNDQDPTIFSDICHIPIEGHRSAEDELTWHV